MGGGHLSLINIIGGKKRFGKKWVLRGIDLDIERGEIMALVGPSGSGKSTLLRALNRLMDLDSGSINYRGKDIREYDPVELRRSAVLVPQESVMLEGSVFDNVSYGQRLKGDVDEELVGRSIRDAGLSMELIERDAGKLSGGEKKRVALARALAIEPDLLLLDEPTVGVDPKRVKKVERTILNIRKKRSLTVIWVTHDVPQAMRVSNRIANLKRGKVREVTPASDFRWEGAY